MDHEVNLVGTMAIFLAGARSLFQTLGMDVFQMDSF